MTLRDAPTPAVTAGHPYRPGREDFRGLAGLAIPVVVVQLGLMAMGVVDTIMVGHVSAADLAAAAHLSIPDYLGDVPWNEDEAAKNWYARIKSRPSFRPILGDMHPGVPPSPRA